MIEVWHCDIESLDSQIYLTTLLGDREQRYATARQLLAEEKYRRVATVEGDDMDAAFRLTNTVEAPWYNNAATRPEFDGKPGVRSTAVGDLMRHDGAWWLVECVGFRRIDG